MSLQNQNSTKIINLITICKKAGKLVMGMDPVKDSIKIGKTYCVCVVNDLSPKSLKEMNFVCQRDSIPILKMDISMDDLWAALGKKVGILGVIDRGFSNKLNELIENKG